MVKRHKAKFGCREKIFWTILRFERIIFTGIRYNNKKYNVALKLMYNGLMIQFTRKDLSMLVCV